MINRKLTKLLEKSPLGKKTLYKPYYDPELLFAIPRQQKREEINIPSGPLPFFGYDIWNHYEVSWLNQRGKPVIAIAEIRYACESSHIVESKSLKLYFNSFNNSRFSDANALQAIIIKDLENIIHSPVQVRLSTQLTTSTHFGCHDFHGHCLDELDIYCNVYQVDPTLLQIENEEKVVDEVLYSNLLKSNCLVTNQPDWGSVQINYVGYKINHESLLKYIISYRNHYEFHEQCIERMFIDIMRQCKPKQLTIYGRYTRRGGIDINPIRSSNPNYPFDNHRLCRQ